MNDGIVNGDDPKKTPLIIHNRSTAHVLLGKELPGCSQAGVPKERTEYASHVGAHQAIGGSTETILGKETTLGQCTTHHLQTAASVPPALAERKPLHR